jgi:hypothetical protein
LQLNLGKSQRAYVKQRAEEIRSNPNFEQQEEYPQSDWRFVAWWNTSFGIASFPDPDTVRQEISTYGTRYYEHFGSWHLPNASIQSDHKGGGNCHPLQKCFFFRSFSIVLR